MKNVTFLTALFFAVFFSMPLFAQDEPTDPDTRAEEQADVSEAGGIREKLLDAEKKLSVIKDEAPPEILSLNLFDNEVSLMLKGYFKGTLTGKFGVQNSPLGFGVAPNDGTPIFMMEADMTLSLWIARHWFVEGSFQEKGSVNTYRAGYKGSEGDVIQYIGIGNRGLDFPEFPYLDFGGNSAQSAGIYAALGGGNLTLHALFRWDAASRQERTFSGGRERTFSFFGIEKRERGISFVLPDENITSGITVYFEDKDGPFQGGGAGGTTRWREARAGEYSASARLGIVDLAATPAGRVAVYYNAGAGYNASMGAYSQSGSFLGEVAAYFSGIDLTQYPQSGQEALTGTPANKPGVITIAGKAALVIYEKGAFSPFERQNRYRSPSSESADAALVDTSSDERIGGFDITLVSESAVLNDMPLYLNAETTARTETYRGLFQVSVSGGNADVRSPRSRWPLAQDLSGRPWFPLAYLDSGGNDDGADVRLRWTNYSSTSGYVLGSDVVPGSVEVLRSGIRDTNFSFDSSTGKVTLQTPATFNEIIRISYLKNSADRRAGSITAGVGAIWQATEFFSTQAAIGIRWNLEPQSYSQEGVSSPGKVGLGAKTAWNYDKLKADIKMGFSYEQTDITGLYRLAGMEGNERVSELSETASFISEPPRNSGTGIVSGLTLANRAGLIYRNYTETDAFGSTSLGSYEKTDAPIIEGRERPYPVRDNGLNGAVLAGEFTLADEKTWAGFQIPLGDGNSISQAKEILLPYRFNLFNTASDFKVVFQIGALADKGNPTNENPELIVEKQVFPDPPRAFSADPQILTINLIDSDRRKLQNAKYLRVLVIKTGGFSSNSISGRVFIAPPIIRGAKFTPLQAQNGIVSSNVGSKISTVETIDNSLQAKYGDIIGRLHPSGAKQRVLTVSWDTLTIGTAAGAGGRIGAVPFSSYKKLSFFVKGAFPANSKLEITMARGLQSYNAPSETAVRITINAADLIVAGSESWTKIEALYEGGKRELRAGDRIINGEFYFNPSALKHGNDISDTSGDSAYVIALVKPDGMGPLPKGEVSIDEIILEDSGAMFNLNGGGNFRFDHNEKIFSAGRVSILENFHFDTAIEGQGRIGSTVIDAMTAGVINRSNASVVLLGAKLEGNAAVSANSENTDIWWSGGHGISRSFGPLSLKENFFLDPGTPSGRGADSALWKHDFSIDLSAPFTAKYSGVSSLDGGKKNRLWSGSVGLQKIGALPLGFSLQTNATLLENAAANALTYGKVWVDTWRDIFPDSGGAAFKRDLLGRFEVRLDTRPVGLLFAADAGSNFAFLENTTQSKGGLTLAVPFFIKDSHAEFRIERSFRRGILFSGATIAQDLEKFGETVANSGGMFGSIPFYSLFDPDLPAKLADSLRASGNIITAFGAFSDKYQINVQFPGATGLSALVIPRSADLRIDRSIDRKYDTTLDVLNTGGSLNFSALNLFGAFGSASLFKFYENDEITNSLSAAVAIPKDDMVSWRCGIEQDFIFYGFAGSSLEFKDNISILYNGWTAAVGIEWTRNVPKSLLGLFYDFVFKKFAASEIWPAFKEFGTIKTERLCKESLDLALTSTKGTTIASNSENDNFTWSLTAGHKSIIRILGRLNLEVFANLAFSGDQKNELFSVIGTIGTSLMLSY